MTLQIENIEPRYTIQDAMERLHLSERTIRRYINSHKFDTILKIGRRYYIPLSSIVAFEKANTIYSGSLATATSTSSPTPEPPAPAQTTETRPKRKYTRRQMPK
jgi:hypothetical protein